jgi:hypothetical protein
MRKGCIHLVVSLLIIMTGLFVEVIGDSFYTQQVRTRYTELGDLRFGEFSRRINNTAYVV